MGAYANQSIPLHTQKRISRDAAFPGRAWRSARNCARPGRAEFLRSINLERKKNESLGPISSTLAGPKGKRQKVIINPSMICPRQDRAA